MLSAHAQEVGCLANESGVPGTFVCSDLCSLSDVLSTANLFDVVFTSRSNPGGSARVAWRLAFEEFKFEFVLGLVGSEAAIAGGSGARRSRHTWALIFGGGDLCHRIAG